MWQKSEWKKDRKFNSPLTSADVGAALHDCATVYTAHVLRPRRRMHPSGCHC